MVLNSFAKAPTASPSAARCFVYATLRDHDINVNTVSERATWCYESEELWRVRLESLFGQEFYQVAGLGELEGDAVKVGLTLSL